MSEPIHEGLAASFRDDLRRAVGLFLELAHGAEPPAAVRKYLPPEGDFDVVAWLMSDLVERVPPDAPFESVQTFAFRLGSQHYRHLKLRISRPGSSRELVFLADSHDSFLRAEPGTPDYEGIEELKRRNAELVSRITEAWDKAGVNTERRYLRTKIREARSRLGAC